MQKVMHHRLILFDIIVHFILFCDISSIFNLLEYDEKHAGLKQNKETLDNHFRSLKKGMNKSRDQDREKLTKLTLESDQCIKKCEKVQKVAADILKVNFSTISLILQHFHIMSLHFTSVKLDLHFGKLENLDWRNVSKVGNRRGKSFALWNSSSNTKIKGRR